MWPFINVFSYTFAYELSKVIKTYRKVHIPRRYLVGTVEMWLKNYATSDPPRHIMLNLMCIKGGKDVRRSKRGIKIYLKLISELFGQIWSNTIALVSDG